ncbi:MAG TPA: DivIVA domain-containing protein [Candidatus Aquicultor sp.]|jgi:cell division initiation protein
MKLTPLDIHHKEFHRSIRGYNEEEVDRFLDEVAEEFEHLFKENIEIKEQIEKSRQDLEGYSGMEKTLQNTLFSAQKSAEEIVSHAKKESELIMRDSELKSKEIIQEAYDLKRKYESTLTHLKQAEEEFRSKFKSMLESYMRIADSTAALADIGSNIIGINDIPSLELEKKASVDQGLPQNGETQHVADIEFDLEPKLAPNTYSGETYMPDDLESLTGFEEAFKPSNKKAVGDDIDLDKPDNFDIDNLAF